MQISEELRTYLDQVSFAALCVSLDLGHGPEAVLVIKSTEDVVGSLRQVAAAVDLGWVIENTEEGPVVCLVLRAHAQGIGELVGEVYFDSSFVGDRDMLVHFGEQEAVRAIFLNEESNPTWTVELPWNEIRRLESEQIADRAEELLEKCGHADFDAARNLFQERVPMDALMARAFPGV